MRNRPARNNSRLLVRQLRRELNGYAPKNGPIDPPVINRRPYYPLVVTMDIPTAGVEELVSSTVLIKRLAQQLGFTSQATANLVVKVKSVHGWAFQFGGTADRVSVNGEVSSLIPTVSDFTQQTSVPPVIQYPILYKFGDFGSFNKPAHFSYVYPKAHQEVVLTADSNFNLLAAAANTDNATLHFHVEWSTAEIAVPVD